MRKIHCLGSELELGVWDIIKVPRDVSYFPGMTHLKVRKSIKAVISKSDSETQP